MRTLKSTLERSWTTIYNLKLNGTPEHMWYNFIYEHTVCSGINLIDAYSYILTQEIPHVLRDVLQDKVISLKKFYGEE